MDQRTKNRRAEHSKPGHELSPVTHPHKPSKKRELLQCTCGWKGWLTKEG
jgi:hypothetical protein